MSLIKHDKNNAESSTEKDEKSKETSRNNKKHEDKKHDKKNKKHGKNASGSANVNTEFPESNLNQNEAIVQILDVMEQNDLESVVETIEVDQDSTDGGNSVLSEETVTELATITASDIDNIYSSVITNQCRCIVEFFGNTHDNADYYALDVERSKKIVGYQDKKGAWRYDPTSYVIYDPDYSIPSTYRWYQGKTGVHSYYASYNTEDRSTDEFSLIGRSQRSPFRPVDPMVAFMLEEALYMVFNRPTDEDLEKGVTSRLPSGSNGIIKASGMIMITKLDLSNGKISIVFATNDILEDYFVTIITNPKTFMPGLLLFNSTQEKEVKRTGPATFYELINSLDDDEDEEKIIEREVPLGVSVFDFGNWKFDRIHPKGNEKWGIEQVSITNNPSPQKIAFGILEAESEQN